VRPDAVRYLGGFRDEVIRRAGDSLLAEIRSPTSPGMMRMETIALSLARRIAEAYSSDVSPATAPRTRHRLDERRLRRVLDYMHGNLETQIGLDDLARVAHLSPFHFHRMFRGRLGMPPHRYLSTLRLERAKALLALGRQPIAEVSLACCFSSQSNFTRAFHRATGATPLQYRRQSG